MLTQIFLPLILATIMFGIGASLKPENFRRVWQIRQVYCQGLLLQLLLVPVFALALILLVRQFVVLNESTVAGLILLSLAPGGATSNLFTQLARGDLALSVTLTAAVSVLSPVWIPSLLSLMMHAGVFPAAEMSGAGVLGRHAILQLGMITALPLCLGMLLRAWSPELGCSLSLWIKRCGSVAIAALIVALLLTEEGLRSALTTVDGMLALSFCTGLLLLTGLLVRRHSGAGPASEAERIARWRTLVIEVGVQNAGVAMMVALVLFQQPQWSALPLAYGVLMNVPVVCLLLFWQFSGGVPGTGTLARFRSPR